MKIVTKQSVVNVGFKEYVNSEIIQLLVLMLLILRSIINVRMNSRIKRIMTYKSGDISISY